MSSIMMLVRVGKSARHRQTGTRAFTLNKNVSVSRFRVKVRARTLTFILDTLTHLLVQAGEQCVQYKGKC